MNPTFSIELAELAKHLPLRLQFGITKHMRAFERAMEYEYLTITADGHLRWSLEGATLLTYFCGKVWCGDRSKKLHHKNAALWIQGNSVFPDKDLVLLFGQRALKQIRHDRKEKVLPQFFEMVDNLFVSPS